MSARHPERGDVGDYSHPTQQCSHRTNRRPHPRPRTRHWTSHYFPVARAAFVSSHQPPGNEPDVHPRVLFFFLPPASKRTRLAPRKRPPPRARRPARLPSEAAHPSLRFVRWRNQLCSTRQNALERRTRRRFATKTRPAKKQPTRTRSPTPRVPRRATRFPVTLRDLGTTRTTRTLLFLKKSVSLVWANSRRDLGKAQYVPVAARPAFQSRW